MALLLEIPILRWVDSALGLTRQEGPGSLALPMEVVHSRMQGRCPNGT